MWFSTFITRAWTETVRVGGMAVDVEHSVCSWKVKRIGQAGISGCF